MKVKELRELLLNAPDDAVVVINIDGSVYPVDSKETIDQSDGYISGNEFGIVIDSLGCP